MEITKVQQWVASAMAFTIGMISSVAMAGYSVWSDTLAENGNAVGLWAMGAVVGVLTIGRLQAHPSPVTAVGLAAGRGCSRRSSGSFVF